MSHTCRDFLWCYSSFSVFQHRLALAEAKHDCYPFFSKPAIYVNQLLFRMQVNVLNRVFSIFACNHRFSKCALHFWVPCTFSFPPTCSYHCQWETCWTLSKLLNLPTFRVMSNPRFAATQHANKQCMYRTVQMWGSQKPLCSVLSELFYWNIME